MLAIAALVAVAGCQPPSDSSPPHLLFVVLDNVRSDRLSLCGYERPTSPRLDAFAREAEWTCDAYAPGAWTLPSHASFFTGSDVARHGAHFDPRASPRGTAMSRAFPLDAAHSTLAEQLSARGYHTILVSANPLVGPAAGLARGFRDVRVATAYGDWYGEPLLEQVSRSLAELDLDAQPVFLFVNISDAHTPYQAVPAGLGWIDPRPKLRSSREPDSDFVRYVNGQLTLREAAAFRRGYGDAYDYAVHRADRTFGALLELLEDAHFRLDATRAVVTSDHGEFLGEHGMVGHCCATWEEDARVPLLVRDRRPRRLEGPINALQSFFLLRDGELRDDVPVRMVAGPNPIWAPLARGIGSETMAAAWHGSEKLVWTRSGAGRDTIQRYDLATDPREARPLRARDGPERAALQAFADEIQRSFSRSPERHEELEQQLRQLGYLD